MPDNLSPEDRRKAMRAVKGSNTSLERKVDAAFQAQVGSVNGMLRSCRVSRTSYSWKHD